MSLLRTPDNNDALGGPLVSVVVPCFNYARYVGETLRSILAQDYPNFELIVVDDGSTDDSVQVIQQVLSNVPADSLVRRVEFVRQANQGVSAALNTALEYSRGEFIATFDADDLMPLGRLKLQIDYLRKQPLVGCLGGEAVRIDEQGQLLPRKNKKKQLSRYDFSQALERTLVVGGGIAVLRREAIDKAGGYDPDIKIQDFQITLRVAKAGFYVDVLPDVVTYYRKHAESLSKNYKAELRYGLQVIDCYKDSLEYERARARLIVKALRMAVIHDKKFAWELVRQVPFKYWDRTMLKRVRCLIFKRPKTGPIETLQ